MTGTLWRWRIGILVVIQIVVMAIRAFQSPLSGSLDQRAIVLLVAPLLFVLTSWAIVWRRGGWPEVKPAGPFNRQRVDLSREKIASRKWGHLLWIAVAIALAAAFRIDGGK
jgi:hypothetical protein